jgi:hypothetical protein
VPGGAASRRSRRRSACRRTGRAAPRRALPCAVMRRPAGNVSRSSGSGRSSHAAPRPLRAALVRSAVSSAAGAAGTARSRALTVVSSATGVSSAATTSWRAEQGDGSGQDQQQADCWMSATNVWPSAGHNRRSWGPCRGDWSVAAPAPGFRRMMYSCHVEQSRDRLGRSLR